MSASWLPAPSNSGTCLVTGASSGIGAAIARQLAGRGYGLTLVARREERLWALAEELTGKPTHVEVISCDLADPGARGALVADIEARGRHVDVLVNSAGLGSYGPFIELDRQRELEQVRVMSESVVDLCGAFAPSMAAARNGAVLIVSSGIGFGGMPGYATYTATKAFCIAFGDSLHFELRHHGVAVSTLCPGPVATEFFDANGPQLVERVIPRRLWQQPNGVARRAIVGLDRNQRVVIPGAAIRGGLSLAGFVPKSLQLRAMDHFLHPSGETRTGSK